MTPSVEPNSLLGGTYRILRRIGSGGMGEVYEATHERLAHRYAVKFLHPGVRDHPEALPRFMREAQITSRLRHPGIVSVVDFNTLPDGSAYLVMEYLEGESLGKVMASTGPLPLSRVVDITDQLSSALTAAHLQGVVHRDMHPQNVFVMPGSGGQSERIKILDFGISKIASVSQKITGMAAVMGTPQYMSPEQAEGKSEELDAASDQFSLAAIVYEMLTGRKAFTGETLASVAYQIVHAAPVPIRKLRPKLPVEMENVVTRALSKNKRDRFPSVSEFAVHLRWTATLPAGDAPSGQGPEPGAPTEIGFDTEETTAVSALPSGMAAVLRESNSDLVAESDDTTAKQANEAARAASDNEMTVVSPASEAVWIDSHETAAKKAPDPKPPAAVAGKERISAHEMTVMNDLTTLSGPGRRRFVIAAAVGSVAIAVAIVVGMARARRPEPPPASVAAPAPAAAPAAPANGPPAIEALPPGKTAAAPPAGDPEPAAAAPAIPAPTEATVPPAPTPATEPTAGERRSSGRTRSHAAAKTPAAAAEAPAPEAVRPSGTCHISVGTYPWSDLWIDGADTGQQTPVVGLSVPCGPHRLQFKRRDLGIDQIEKVILHEGGDFKRQYELRGAGVDE